MTATLRAFSWSALLFVIFFTPLALGSARPMPLFIAEASSFLLFLSVILKEVFSDRALPVPRTPLVLWMSSFLLLVLLQLCLPTLGPVFRHTVYARATFEALFKLLTYCAVFASVLIMIRNPQQMTVLIRAIFILAFIVSLIGVIEKLSGTKKVLWVYELKVNDSPFEGFFATFVNRNHYASFIGMIVFLLLGRFLYLNARYSVSHERKHREEKILLLFVLIICAASLFLSLSRGGMVIFVFSLFVFYQFFLDRRKKQSSLVFGLFVVSTLLMLIWIGFEPISQRLSTMFGKATDMSLQARILVWQSALPAALSHWLTGSGLGTFQYIFLHIQSPEISSFGHWIHAHNDYLELLSDTGIVGFLIVLAVLFCFAKEVALLRKEKQDIYIRYNGAGCVIGLLYVILMSIYDFPLKTPACAIYFAIVAALALRMRFLMDEAQGKERMTAVSLKAPVHRAGAAILVAAVFFVSFAGIWRPFLARQIINKAGKDSIPDLERAISLDPKNSDYHFWMGLAVSRDAMYDGRRRFNDERMNQAFERVKIASSLNPLSGKYEYGLAVLNQKIGERDEAAKYYEKAIEKEPANPFYLIYYAIFCFNDAVVNSVLYEESLSDIERFQTGVKAYFRAKKILPQFSLSQYKNYLASYEKLNIAFQESGLLDPNTLL